VLTPSDMDRVTAGTARSDAWAHATGKWVLTVADSAASFGTSTYELGQGGVTVYFASAAGGAGGAAFGGNAPSAETGADVATELPVPTSVGGTIDRTFQGRGMQITNKAAWKAGFIFH
jgi:hypothetical protein